MKTLAKHIGLVVGP